MHQLQLQLLILFMLIFINKWKVHCQDWPIVDTNLGKIRGTILKSRLGNDIYSFRSVRYAKAPINELRFQPPVPVDKWNNVYDATQPGPVCSQPNNANSSEDCLMLNVYINKLPTNDNIDLNRPVMVFFHPGGFYVFNGASYMFGPEYLLDEDIVLVTANYRLGFLGFLSTGSQEAPGNNGLKDQVVVLKWVHDNIKAFGGNPNMVTLSGYNVGAVSTVLHMISPMSKGLFHKGIIMSGSPFGAGKTPTNQYDLAKKLARLVNCSDDSPANIINCLKTKSAQEIADTINEFTEVGGDPISLCKGIVEPDFGQERFLTEHPETAVLNGRFAKIPLMIGITENELGFVSHMAIRSQAFLDLLTNDYKRILPNIFDYERNTERSNRISKALKQFYLGEGKIDNTSRVGIEHLYADGVTGFAVNRAVKLISAKNTENTYYYYFTYAGKYSSFYLPGTNSTQTAGASYHDDLMYLFYMSSMFPYINKDDPVEWNTVSKMVQIWTDFLTTGNPTPRSSKRLNNVKWIPYSKDSPKYLEIGEKLVIKESLNEDRYKKWEELFPLSD